MTLEEMRRYFIDRFIAPMFDKWVAEAKQAGAISADAEVFPEFTWDTGPGTSLSIDRGYRDITNPSSQTCFCVYRPHQSPRLIICESCKAEHAKEKAVRQDEEAKTSALYDSINAVDEPVIATDPHGAATS